MSRPVYLAIVLSHLIASVSLEAQDLFATEKFMPSLQNMAAWMIEANLVAKNYAEDLDHGRYELSWEKSDSLFQSVIKQSEWIIVSKQKRQFLGKMTSRLLKDQRHEWNPVGLPPGLYMVVEYVTSFEKRPQSYELLTLRRGADGQWRVLTYKIS